MSMKKFLLPIIAIMMLVCLFPMPYGYYQITRFVSTVVFAYLAYTKYKENNDELMFMYGAFAVLFQPFLTIKLGRGMWNLVDVVIAAILLYIFWKEHKKSSEK